MKVIVNHVLLGALNKPHYVHNYVALNLVRDSYIPSTAGELYIRRAFDPKAEGLEGLEWDGAELYLVSHLMTLCEGEVCHSSQQLKASETMNYDDAFTLEVVSRPLLDKFNFVAGIVPVLTTYLDQVGCLQCCCVNQLLLGVQCGRSEVVSVQDAYLVANALKDLANYISGSSSDRENKERQKLLRNLRVLELIIGILGQFNPETDRSK